MNVLTPVLDFFTRTKPKQKDYKLSILTSEKVFLDNGFYKIKDEYSKNSQVVTLCKVEDGEDFANKKAAAIIKKSFDAYMYSFVQNPFKAQKRLS
ncbi:hypothetical protein [Cesiribacter sp. SM1]|uniref:hypothetical protein n=1 Tax=Cesiribacter sp. SM1 TaxID=2861196 RepID=UPI001CD23139|nr:hypothetical protein [Cesiribacter sp. SM1]